MTGHSIRVLSSSQSLPKFKLSIPKFKLLAWICASTLLIGAQLGYAQSSLGVDDDLYQDSEQAQEPLPGGTGVQEGLLPLDDLRMFAKVFSQIRAGYVEDISDSDLLEYAIKGMLSELDPHSTYLDSSSFEDLQVNTLGQFGGLGIEVEMENGFVKIIAPIDDTPAARAGLQSGDLIIKLDDKAVKGMSRDEALDSMRGEKGSEIRLTIVREGKDQPLEITLVRDIIKVRSVRGRMLEPGYGYIRIAQFQINTGPDMVDAIKKLQKEDVLKGLILDLRNNPGGVLQAAVDAADVFLDSGLVVYTEGRVSAGNFQYHAKPGDLLNNLPVVVLVNEGSASASEILAGALQDHHRAVIVGTNSFGKGSVQTVMQISEDKAIKLTTALYYTPNGRSIQAEGIRPDILVEPAEITARRDFITRPTEADLQNHLENGKRTKKSSNASSTDSEADDTAKTASQTPSWQFGQDNQLYEALNMLKGINIFGQRNTNSTTTLAKNQAGDLPIRAQEKPVKSVEQ